MASAVLVDDRVLGHRGEAGHRLLVELVRAGVDVSAAGWFRTADDGRWLLYIASDSVRPGKPGNAYATFYDCLFRLPGKPLDTLTVRLVPDDHPFGRFLTEALDGGSDRRAPVQLGGGGIGEFEFAEGYLYPRVTSGLMRDEVVRTVTDLIQRPDPGWRSTVTLRDGTVIEGIPFGVEANRTGGRSGVVEIKIDDNGKIHSIPADDIANIQ